MLVLDRKKSESIVLRQAGRVLATVTLLRVHGSGAKLGFVADRSVEIVRTELLADGQGPMNPQPCAA